MGAMYEDTAYGEALDEHAGTMLPEGFETLPSHIRNAHIPERLSEEEAFARKIASKRQAELARRVRIFDGKRRTIGCDKEMLDQQVEENKQKRQDAANAEKDAGAMMAYLDRTLKLREAEKLKMKRGMEKECKDYSLINLDFESRREYDLNDKLAHRKGMPARVGDDDPRCGPASMQQFNGEDLMKGDRVKQQQTAMQSYIEQQRFEKALLEDDGSTAMAIAAEAAEITALRNQMEENEALLRRELQREQQTNNLNKADENIQRKQALQAEEDERNNRELEFNLTDPFLNENGVLYKANGQVVRDTYKGSTREERVQVAQEQLIQTDADQHRRMGGRGEVLQHAAYTEGIRKQLLASDRQSARDKRAATKAIADENLRLREEKAQRTVELNQMYTNKFSPEFFEQFGTHTR